MFPMRSQLVNLIKFLFIEQNIAQQQYALQNSRSPLGIGLIHHHVPLSTMTLHVYIIKQDGLICQHFQNFSEQKKVFNLPMS